MGSKFFVRTCDLQGGKGVGTKATLILAAVCALLLAGGLLAACISEAIDNVRNAPVPDEEED